MADMPLPGGTVGRQAAKFQDSMRDVERLIAVLKAELISLEVYARERAGEVRGHYQSTEASKAYVDMADRIKALRGDG